ncbi:MAG: stage II sporulation protein M [Nanoarchaeota archaeon]
MVFESLINPIKAEKRPWKMLFIGIIYTSVAIILSLYIFREYSSLVMIFLTMLPSVPLIYSAIKMEEKKDTEYHEEKFLIKEHGKVLAFYVFLFFGMVISFALWYAFLPVDLSSLLFQTQIKEIQEIHEINLRTGNAISLFSAFSKILMNNVWVLIFSLLFSFIYCIGGIFILAWNASIIGTAIGIFIKNSIHSYFLSVPLGLLRYSIHGIPEITAYFVAGLSGGLISIAVVRHGVGSEKFARVFVDSLNLIIISVVILIIAGLLEVFVTPIIF